MLAAAAGLGVAAGALVLSQGLQPCDDAYITFRHARNLVRQLRPAWNLEGPPVLGSTSPAFLFLLGALGLLFRTDRVPELALLVNAALLAAVTVLAYLVARDLTGRALPSLLAAAVVGFNSVNVSILSQGFEAGLLTAVLLAGLYLARTGRDFSAMLLASLTPLVRPEGLLLTPLVWGPILLARRFRPRLLGAYIALPLAWLVFASAYYGSPVPQSIRARAAVPSVFRPYSGGRIELDLGIELAGRSNIVIHPHGAAPGDAVVVGVARLNIHVVTFLRLFRNINEIETAVVDAPGAVPGEPSFGID